MTDVTTFERNLDDLIAQLSLYNIRDGEFNMLNDELLSQITERISNLHVPHGVIPTPSKYIMLLIKALRLAAPLIDLIPYGGGAFSVGIKLVVEYLSQNKPDIKEMIHEEIQDINHNANIDRANGIIRQLQFSLSQIQTTSNPQGEDVLQVPDYIMNSMSSTERFLGEMESRIRRESQWNDENIVISDAKRLILFTEVYCYLNLIVLLHYRAFKMYFPSQSMLFDKDFQIRKETFDQTIQFLAQDNPIVSCFYPSRHFAINMSLKYFDKRVQSIAEIHTDFFQLTDHTGSKLSVDYFFPRLISDKFQLCKIGDVSRALCCFKFKQQTSDNIYKMYVKTREYAGGILITHRCYFKENTINVGVPGGDDTCRLTRVSAGKYMISDSSTCKPYRMNAPICNIIKPLQLETSFNCKVFFDFEEFEGIIYRRLGLVSCIHLRQVQRKMLSILQK